MNELIKFLFNFENIHTNLRGDWLELYDSMFIDDKLIANLKKNNDLLTDLINYVNMKASGTNVGQSTGFKSAEANGKDTIQTLKKLTVPVPFNLTVVKPKRLAEPIKISNKVEFKPIPIEEFKKTSLNKIEKAHELMKKEIKEN